MIDLVGKKRLSIISILLLVCGLLGAAYYLYYMPEQDSLERQLRTIQSQASSKKSEVRSLSEEYAQIQKQKAYFQNLEEAGFFSQQSRAVASRFIENVQEFSKVLSARYTIDPAEIEEQEDAKKAGYVVLSSPISISIDALDDLDIYEFVFWLKNTLPGQVSVKKVRIQKESDITEARIRQIGSGNPSPMITAIVELDWQTIVPSEDVRRGE